MPEWRVDAHTWFPRQQGFTEGWSDVLVDTCVPGSVQDLLLVALTKAVLIKATEFTKLQFMLSSLEWSGTRWYLGRPLLSCVSTKRFDHRQIYANFIAQQMNFRYLIFVFEFSKVSPQNFAVGKEITWLTNDVISRPLTSQLWRHRKTISAEFTLTCLWRHDYDVIGRYLTLFFRIGFLSSRCACVCCSIVFPRLVSKRARGN